MTSSFSPTIWQRESSLRTRISKSTVRLVSLHLRIIEVSYPAMMLHRLCGPCKWKQVSLSPTRSSNVESNCYSRILIEQPMQVANSSRRYSVQNTKLVNFCEKRAESQQVENKYIDVLEHAKNVAKTNDVMVTRLGYREVATHYGCSYNNDGYRVMEEMAERVPGVTYKESRTRCVDDAMGVGRHHIEITFAHPDLAGWMRAHEANAVNGGH